MSIGSSVASGQQPASSSGEAKEAVGVKEEEADGISEVLKRKGKRKATEVKNEAVAVKEEEK